MRPLFLQGAFDLFSYELRSSLDRRSVFERIRSVERRSLSLNFMSSPPIAGGDISDIPDGSAEALRPTWFGSGSSSVVVGGISCWDS